MLMGCVLGVDMSRTERGSKPVGYDYWSARPLNRGGGCVGGFTKTLTCRIERRNSKKLVRKEIDEHTKDLHNKE
jgi:hypothetical protein